MALWKKNTLLLLLCLVIIITPLLLLPNAEFGGADGQAGDMIETINPDYVPWFEPFMEPASGEIESLLFASQAALGAGVVGFVLGRITAKPKKKSENEV